MEKPNLIDNSTEGSQKRLQVKYAKLKHDYQVIFSTSEGQRVLEDILRSGFAYKTSIVPGDPYGTHVNEGRRMLAQHIEYMAKKDKDKESNKNQKKAVT